MTQCFFDDVIKDIHAFLKPLGFKKKALNFYRLNNGFHQLIHIQKSAYNSKEEISFTMEICVGVAQENDSPFPSKYDFAIRERIGRIKENQDLWYYLEGNYPHLYERKQRFEQTRQAVLNDIEKVALPFFEQMNDADKLDKFYDEKYGN